MIVCKTTMAKANLLRLGSISAISSGIGVTTHFAPHEAWHVGVNKALLGDCGPLKKTLRLGWWRGAAIGLLPLEATDSATNHSLQKLRIYANLNGKNQPGGAAPRCIPILRSTEPLVRLGAVAVAKPVVGQPQPAQIAAWRPARRKECCSSPPRPCQSAVRDRQTRGRHGPREGRRRRPLCSRPHKPKVQAVN